MNKKNIFAALALPGLIILFTFTYQIIWNIFGLPKGAALIGIISNFFDQHGLWIVFICSIVESAVIIGNYFPGGAVIFIAVIAAGDNVAKAAITVAVVSLGFCFGYCLDYLLGKFGWYKLLLKFGIGHELEAAQKKLGRHSLKAIAASYWEVNLASITATAAGVLQMNFNKFFWESLIGIAVWNSFWGVLVYSLGKDALKLIFDWKYIVPVAGAWILLILAKKYYNERKINT